MVVEGSGDGASGDENGTRPCGNSTRGMQGCTSGWHLVEKVLKEYYHEQACSLRLRHHFYVYILSA